MSAAPEIIWFVVGLALILLEFLIPGVIIVFFGIGACLVSLTTHLGLTGTVDSQLIVFSITSVVLLLSLRRWIRGKFTGYVTDEQDPSKNYDDFVGNVVTALEDLQPGKSGAVEFRGTRWRAVADAPIRQGEEGQIERLDGITLIIRKRGGAPP